MSDHAFLDLVNHAELDPRYGAYAGFDGVILHAQRQRETGEIVDVDLRGPGQIECDIAYTGLRRIMITEDASPSIPAYPAGFYVFAGFDVGKFDLEYGAYSLIINYGLDGRRRPPALNRFFLFDRREDAASLLGAWTGRPLCRQRNFHGRRNSRPARGLSTGQQPRGLNPGPFWPICGANLPERPAPPRIVRR